MALIFLKASKASWNMIAEIFDTALTAKNSRIPKALGWI